MRLTIKYRLINVRNGQEDQMTDFTMRSYIHT